MSEISIEKFSGELTKEALLSADKPETGVLLEQMVKNILVCYPVQTSLVGAAILRVFDEKQGYNVWEMYGKSLLFSPRNVHFTLSKMTIANQTQLTSICFGCDRAALSASSLVGELSVTLRDLPHTLFGSLASNAAPIRYNLRIVTDIAIVGPRTLATAGA